MNSTQIRQLAKRLTEFADRADRLGISGDELAVLVSTETETLLVTVGAADDKNAFFYLYATNPAQDGR
jgi:hypothetical protein